MKKPTKKNTKRRAYDVMGAAIYAVRDYMNEHPDHFPKAIEDRLAMLEFAAFPALEKNPLNHRTTRRTKMKTKTMKITATSTFHGNISQTFRVPAECGRYPLRCSYACDGKKIPGTGIQMHCGCGWPVARTEWDAPEGFAVRAEWADAWDNAGRNNIIIVVE